MAKYGTVTFNGVSGTAYTFYAYSMDTSFKKGFGAVYFITKRIEKAEGGASHTRIYVGQTGDLSDRFNNHYKQQCFNSHGANCICILGEQSEVNRLAIEEDLIAKYNPPCNG